MFQKHFPHCRDQMTTMSFADCDRHCDQFHDHIWNQIQHQTSDCFFPKEPASCYRKTVIKINLISGKKIPEFIQGIYNGRKHCNQKAWNYQIGTDHGKSHPVDFIRLISDQHQFCYRKCNHKPQ